MEPGRQFDILRMKYVRHIVSSKKGRHRPVKHPTAEERHEVPTEETGA